ACLVVSVNAFSADLLPDLITRQADLYDNAIVTNVIPGRIHLALSNGTANIGAGELRLVGGPQVPGTEKQTVSQRVSDSNGGSRDIPAGEFTYHPTHDHIHFDNWSVYRLREVLPGDSVGTIIAEGDKTSFCILDFEVYDATLPNYLPGGAFFTCDQSVQGISVGWIDIYTKDLPGQQIDVTDIPDGVYWLESEVDPLNLILESDETNNIARIKVVIGSPAELIPDGYEPNDSTADILSQNLGGPDSPNLGPTGPELTIDNLSVHSFTDVDFYRFYCNAIGSPGDFARIDFRHNDGDLDLELYDDQFRRIARSNGLGDTEQIELSGLAPGWYFLKVYGYNGAINPQYSLSINPPENFPPSLTVTAPTTADSVIHGRDSYQITWTFSDPERDSVWALVYANTSPSFDSSAILLSKSGFVPAAFGSYQVNSAHLQATTYWFYVELYDGGTVTGDWAPAPVTFLSGLPCPAGDANSDGTIGIADITFLIEFVFRSGPPPVEVINGDPSGDSLINIADITFLIARVFKFGPPPVCP
ncbi:MAG: lysyl oxidase family protein, partial [Candidatus Zixiibacteriota bacterium]